MGYHGYLMVFCLTWMDENYMGWYFVCMLLILYSIVYHILVSIDYKYHGVYIYRSVH